MIHLRGGIAVVVAIGTLILMMLGNLWIIEKLLGVC